MLDDLHGLRMTEEDMEAEDRALDVIRLTSRPVLSEGISEILADLFEDLSKIAFNAPVDESFADRAAWWARAFRGKQ